MRCAHVPRAAANAGEETGDIPAAGRRAATSGLTTRHVDHIPFLGPPLKKNSTKNAFRQNADARAPTSFRRCCGDHRPGIRRVRGRARVLRVPRALQQRERWEQRERDENRAVVETEQLILCGSQKNTSQKSSSLRDPRVRVCGSAFAAVTVTSTREATRRVAAMRAFATRPRVVVHADTKCAHRRETMSMSPMSRDVSAAAVPHRGGCRVFGFPGSAHRLARHVVPRTRQRGFAASSGPGPGPGGTTTRDGEEVCSSSPSVASAAPVGGGSDTNHTNQSGFGFGRSPLSPTRFTSKGTIHMDKSTLILGIETSCDDTAVAVITGTGAVLGEAIAKQDEIHAQWGGVVPNLGTCRAFPKSLRPFITPLLTSTSH